MARNKNSTALFDVIHSAKKPPKASPSASIPTPKWWGKDKKLPKPVVAESTENAGRQQSWLSAAKRNAGLPASAPASETTQLAPAIEPFYVEQIPLEVEPSPLDPSAEIELTTPALPAEPKPRFIDRFKNKPSQHTPKVEEVFTAPLVADEPVWSEPEDEVQIKPDRPARQERDVPFRLDSKSGDVRFNLSIGGIIALVFIVLIALAIAFIAGTRSSSQAFLNDSVDGKDSPTTNSTSGMMAALGPVKSGDTTPVHPDVMQVPPRLSSHEVSTPANTAPAKTLPIKSTRDIGMIYVVVQSYAEPELAQRACDFMNKSGIPCSLVQGPDGWAPRDWYSVVGLQPFARHDPGLADYERSVKAAGIRFTTKIMDQFQPQAYTWRETSDLSPQ